MSRLLGDSRGRQLIALGDQDDGVVEHLLIAALSAASDGRTMLRPLCQADMLTFRMSAFSAMNTALSGPE